MTVDADRSPADQIEDVLSLLDPDETSVIVCDTERLARQLDHLERAFPSEVRHAVAIKTMPHPSLLRFLVERGVGLEAASFEEVMLAREAGASPASIIFDSPVKTQAEIDRADAQLAGMLCNANSLSELERYPSDPSVTLGLRINPQRGSSAPARYDVSAKESKFGVPVERRADILEAAVRFPIEALHVHIGSRIDQVEDHVAAAGILVDLADEIDEARSSAGSSRRIRIIDIGGGLQADPPTLVASTPSLVDRLAAQLLDEVPRLFDREVRTELGQWIHTHAGWVASRVEYIDEGDTPHAFIHVGADLFVRDVYTEPRPFRYSVHRPGGSIDDGPKLRYDIEGPLCFAGDTLGRSIELPRLEVGDWLLIEGTGANTFGLWSRHCSRRVPSVVATTSSGAVRWSGPRAVI